MASINFHPSSIDFVNTYENFKKRYKPRTLRRKSFGAPIVLMANSVITTYFDRGSIKGVRKCLEYEIERLRWWETIWVIPLFEIRLFSGLDSEFNRKRSRLLADSLILTIIAYRVQLNEKNTGLAYAILSDVILGFELVCDWVQRGVKIAPLDNELIATFDIPHLMQFIPEE